MICTFCAEQKYATLKKEPCWGNERIENMKQRQTELDILRFLATLAVIVIHMGRIPYVADCWAESSVEMSIVPLVWCVPVFFMISGRFFLDPEKNITLKNLYPIILF